MLGYILCEQCKAAENLKQSLKNTPLEEGKKRELISAIHGHFRDWLFGDFQHQLIISLALHIWYCAIQMLVLIVNLCGVQLLVTSVKYMIFKLWIGWTAMAWSRITGTKIYSPAV